MKTINTLVSDVYSVISGGIPNATSNTDVTVSYDKWFTPRSQEREDKILYFSEVGIPCPRQLWYKYNAPEIAVKPDGNLLLKFFYGDILEELVLNVSESAGHIVEKKQERVLYEVGGGWYVRGRIDAVIDGVVVDVKSVTKYSEEKFKGGLVDDPFGYYQQLNGYAAALNNDAAGFVTIQKELGHINYYPIQVDRGLFAQQADFAVETVTSNIAEIPRLEAVPQSKTSKNKKLCTACSYCSFKSKCWPEMRTFLYSRSLSCPSQQFVV
jgi:CRISPR/Cas system-associated exonuclease Cas4 (RecB family)